MTNQEFIEAVAKCVRKYAPAYGIKCCSAIIAQAILESGWGKSRLAAQYHNYFGLKCGSGWTGASVNMSTQEEYSPGTMTTISDNFRAYPSMDAGIKGYFEFIQYPRYHNLRGITDPKQYLETIRADGYATSYSYVTSTYSVVTAHNLTKYDKNLGSAGVAGTLVKSGQFTLRIDTDGASSGYGSGSHQGQTSFGSKYNIPCPADKVPFVVAPLNTTVGGKSTGQLIGCMALVVDNGKKTQVWCLVGDAGPAKNGWGEVSLKCAWDLGYSKKEANGSQGPNGNFSIYVWPSVKPNWSSSNLVSQIKSEGEKLGGADGLTSYDVATGNYILREQINHRYIKQYIITIDRNTPTPDYTTLKKNRVVGVIIEAGYLYDSVHMETYPRNPKIDEQCRKASECKMPFGLYWTLKARSIDEAKRELYELSFMIRKYPPVLGMWVYIMLSQSESTNNAIVDTYYNEFVRLGLKGKVGFYATAAEIKKIDWEKHSENWFLWLNKHVKDMSEIDALLDPQFFVI